MSHHRDPFTARSRPVPGADPRMRMSDADRQEISDALSRHFADGRLDSAEFDERLGRVMAAKTWADVAGLLDDLPPLAGEDPPPPPRRRHLPRPLPGLLLVLLAVASMASVMATVHVPWVLLAVGAWLLWRRGPGCHRRWAGPPRV